MYEEDVFVEIHKGRSLRDIAKQFGISKNKVDRIKKDGGYYTDVSDINNLRFNVFYDKILSEQEQICHIIMEYNDVWLSKRECEDNEIKQLIEKKSFNSRVANYLNVNVSTISRWNNKEVKLVKEDLRELYEMILEDFYDKEVELFKSFYCVDGRGFVKGFKLNYIDYYSKEGLAYYINIYAKRYCNTELSDKEFLEKYMNEYKKVAKENGNTSKSFEFIGRISIKCGIALGKWMQDMINKGYSMSELEDCIGSYIKYFKTNYSGKIRPPQALYYEVQGYIALNKELKLKMYNQYIENKISGIFKMENPLNIMFL